MSLSMPCSKPQEEIQARREQQSRPHVYELDPLRVVTALVVVAVHVLAFTAFLNHTDLGVQIQNAVVISTHFTREVFMFVTAFALTYVYYGKPFSLKRFWTKRSVGVLLPYSIWSIVYVWVNAPQQSPGLFVKTVIFDILTGRASYQLYYILLTLQLYILLPLFLFLLKHVKQHPWKVLIVSFVIQVLMMYADYHYLETGSLASSGIWQIVAAYQDSFVFTYQFFFILGALAALYLQQVRTFLLRHGKWTFSGFIVALAAIWGHFFLQVRVYHESLGYATSVLQPIMVFYSLAVIAFFFWLTYRWAKREDQTGHPKGYWFWHTLSDASFGIYLIHALVLTAMLRWVVPNMPQVWPVFVRVFLTWFLTAGGATVISVILMNVPILSRLVGRSRPLPGGFSQGVGRKPRPFMAGKNADTRVRVRFLQRGKENGQDKLVLMLPCKNRTRTPDTHPSRHIG